MAPITILSLSMALIGALFLCLVFSPAGRIWQRISGPLRGKWLIILYLMAFFLLGYILFVSLLISDPAFPVEAVTAGVFLGGAVGMMASIGAAQYRHDEDVKSFIQRVDRLMYAAKTGGKDRVCFER